MSMYNIGSYSNNKYYKAAEQQAEQEASSILDEIENENATLTPEEIENKLNEQKAIYLNSLNNYFFVLSEKSKVQALKCHLSITKQ